jgi:hypothetical protein
MDRTATLGLLVAEVAVAAAVEALQTCSVVLVVEDIPDDLGAALVQEEYVREELALRAFVLARRE